MKTRNRLAIKICNATQRTNYYCDKNIKCFGTGMCAYCLVIADELIANGIIMPPCKIGDTVYTIHRNSLDLKYFIKKYEVYNISVLKDEVLIYVTPIIWFNSKDIGKTVFLSREEAEKALREMSL